jgi:hypothetical protein
MIQHIASHNSTPLITAVHDFYHLPISGSDDFQVQHRHSKNDLRRPISALMHFGSQISTRNYAIAVLARSSAREPPWAGASQSNLKIHSC